MVSWKNKLQEKLQNYDDEENKKSNTYSNYYY